MFQMRRSFLVYAATLLAFLAMDAAWLTFVAIDKFRAQLGDVMRPDPVISAAFVFYPLYALGLLLLAVKPGIEQNSLSKAAFAGALVGLTAYATFDLTNLIIIRGWTVALAALDVTWGVVVSAAASFVGAIVGSRYSEPASRVRSRDAAP